MNPLVLLFAGHEFDFAPTKKPALFITVIALLCLCSLVFPSFAGTRPKFCFKNTCIELEIADTDQSRARGLMFREKLAEGQGMLFIFPEDGVYSFWMKNTLIPLDIIWLDKDLKVVQIRSNVAPCQSNECPSYNPQIKAKYVLEVNAGFCLKFQIKTGEKAYLDNDRS
jgi:uncharacterized protein